MPIKPLGEIYDVLSRAGVVTQTGRMTCPHCAKRNLTASADKGIAKCWSCNRAWTTKFEDEPKTNAWSWDSVLMNKLAEAVKADIEYDQEARMYLVDRKIPNDLEFFYENDLGTVPCDMESLVREWLPEARHSAGTEVEPHRAFIAEWSEKVSGLRGEPKKKVLAQLELAESFIEQTKSIFERISANMKILANPQWNGALCYVYRDAEGLVSSINVRQYLNEYATTDHESERRVIRIQPRRRGVFGGSSMAFSPGGGWGEDAPSAVIVEGEHNALSLVAAARRWGHEYFLPVIAVGGKNGGDLDCIRSLVAWEEEPLAVYDNDKLDESTGMPGGYSLIESLSTVLFLSVTTTPTKDLDDWFVAGDRSPQSFLETIVEPAVPLAKSFESVAAEVQAALEGDDEINLRTRIVTAIIIRDLRRRGTLYTTDGYTSVLMRYQTKDRLIPVRKGMAAFNSLIRKYGLVQPQWVDAAGIAINIAALTAPVRKVNSLAHFVNGHLYINCYDDRMLRLSPDGSVDILPNGFDEILVCHQTPSLIRGCRIKST